MRLAVSPPRRTSGCSKESSSCCSIKTPNARGRSRRSSGRSASRLRRLMGSQVCTLRFDPSVRRVRVRDTCCPAHGRPVALTVVRLAVLDRPGETCRVRSAVRRIAVRRELPDACRRGGDCSGREPRAKSLAAFGRSGSYTRVTGQNPRPETPPATQLSAPESYVTRAELAAIMGVSLATVDRMVAEGVPSVTWGRRTRRFRPSVAISWALKRERAA